MLNASFNVALSAFHFHAERCTKQYTVLRATRRVPGFPHWFACRCGGGHRGAFPGQGELGLLAAEPALGLSNLHAFPGFCSDEIRLEICDRRQHVEQQPADHVGRAVDIPAQAQLFSGGSVDSGFGRTRLCLVANWALSSELLSLERRYDFASR